MATGRFNSMHNNYFNAVDGAYTTMTAEEVRKDTYNVKAVIRTMAIKNNLPQATKRNKQSCIFKISDKVTGFSSASVTLTFKLSKPAPKNEMTIYFNASSGVPGNKLADGNVWFIYFKANDPEPWLGIMTPFEWAAVTAATAITSTPVATGAKPKPVSLPVVKRKAKTLSQSDLQEEERLDRELIDDISDSIILETAPFGYSKAPKEKQEPVSSGERRLYKRDKQVALNALVKAKHMCESNPAHTTFLRKRGYLRYMEPHHLIPLAYQDDFEYSLDIEQNIVSLCSNCHNQLHYGAGVEPILKKLYQERAGYLRCAGINISFEYLLEIYN